jgi:hypothetical protein
VLHVIAVITAGDEKDREESAPFHAAAIARGTPPAQDEKSGKP